MLTFLELRIFVHQMHGNEPLKDQNFQSYSDRKHRGSPYPAQRVVSPYNSGKEANNQNKKEKTDSDGSALTTDIEMSATLGATPFALRTHHETILAHRAIERSIHGNLDRMACR